MPTILRPSSADIWTNCAAQPSIVERFVTDDTPSDAAMEGTCAAWLAEMVLTGQAKNCSSLVGEQCPDNNWPVDFTMANHIQDYVDMITRRGGVISAERRVYLNEFINGTPDAYATVKNAPIYCEPTTDPNAVIDQSVKLNGPITLHVDDLKYGYSIVQPTSKQVTIYGGAIYNQAVIKPDKIVIGIYQPRAFHVDGIYRTRTLTPPQLAGEIEQIVLAGRRCFESDPQATPGRHCKYCPAAYVCPAISTEMYDIVTIAQGSTARHMNGQELSNQLEFLVMAEDVLKGMKTSIEAEANARMDAGKHVPGWARERGKGRRRFNTGATMVLLGTGIDPRADKMCTPAELDRRGANPAIMKMITEIPDTKPRLVRMKTEDFARKFGE